MADETPQIEWGWRIQCAEPDCKEHLSVFRSVMDEPNSTYYGSGPPSLPYTGKCSEDGWFFQSVTHRERSNSRIYRAYCPKHSAAALVWSDKMDAWRKARWNIGKQTHTSFLDRLKEWGSHLLHIKVGQTIQEWLAANPKPEPPWGV